MRYAGKMLHIIIESHNYKCCDEVCAKGGDTVFLLRINPW